MKIGGLMPLSLSDFPGRVAAVIFTQGCNFRCPFCHNGNLIPMDREPGDLLREEEIFSLLAARCGKLGGVVISGGEPTLQPDLPDFLLALKELGYAIKLDTNGSRPEVLARVLPLVDYVAMDLKAPLPCYARLAGVAVAPKKIRQSIELLAASGVEHEFRTTAVEPLLDQRDLDEIFALVPVGSKYRVQPFRPENALAEWLRTAAPALQPRPVQVLTGESTDEH